MAHSCRRTEGPHGWEAEVAYFSAGKKEYEIPNLNEEGLTDKEVIERLREEVAYLKAVMKRNRDIVKGSWDPIPPVKPSWM